MSGGKAVFLNNGSAAPRHARLLANLRCQPDRMALLSCVDQIWRRLLEVLADPITVTQNDGRRTVTFAGVVRFCVAQTSGAIHVEELVLRNGVAVLTPVSNFSIDLPARLDGAWLDAFLVPFRQQMLATLADCDREQCAGQLRAAVKRELARCIEQRTHWRRLRHALRDVIGLDRDLLRAIRQGRHRLVRFYVSEQQYNRALANRTHYRQILAENPNLLWLYNFTDEIGISLPAGDIISALKNRLMAQTGLTSATWRYLSRCNYDHFRHVIDFIGLDGTTSNRWPELVHWLRWTTALGYRTPMSPAIIRLFEHDPFDVKDDGRIVCFRAVDLQTGVLRALLKEAEARHAAGALDRFANGDLVDVMTWLQVERPTLDANQVRRGWRYLASRALAWKEELACRPVLAAVEWDSLVPRRVHGAWTVLPVTDAWTLRQEALAMRHCVDSSLPECTKGSCRIFSVGTGRGKRVATIGITLESGRWRVTQVRGFANNPVCDALRAVAEDTAASYDVLYRIVGAPVDVGDVQIRNAPVPVRPQKKVQPVDAQVDADKKPGPARPAVARVSEVTVHHEHRDTMASDWTDQVTVSRTTRKRFTVRARKHAETFDGKAGRRWLTLDKRSDILTARELHDSLVEAAYELDVELDWECVVSKIARMDWLMAAVLARDNDLPLPALPSSGSSTYESARNVLGGRHLSRVTVGVEWGDDMHTLPVRMDDWIAILAGQDYAVDAPYWAEGKRFKGEWRFDSHAEDALTVGYDDGGVGYAGSLAGAMIEGPVWCGHDIARLLADAYRCKHCY